MNVDLQVGEEGIGRLDETVKVVPTAMTGQLVLQIAPQALNYKPSENTSKWGTARVRDAKVATELR
jgi:hypothetical protein